MKKFDRHKTYDEIRAQCQAQGIPLNDHLFCSKGYDTIVVNHAWNTPLRDGYAVYSVFNGKFHGVTDGGDTFDSSSTKHEKEPWFQALLSFFYVEKAHG